MVATPALIASARMRLAFLWYQGRSKPRKARAYFPHELPVDLAMMASTADEEKRIRAGIDARLRSEE